MTQPMTREFGSDKAALSEALEALSQADMNAATGVSPQVLWEASHPNTKKLPALRHCAALAVALRARGLPDVITAYFEQRREKIAALLGGAVAHQPLPPTQRLIQVTADVGDVATRMSAALADQKITPVECAATKREVRETIERLQALERDLDAACAPRPVPATLMGGK